MLYSAGVQSTIIKIMAYLNVRNAWSGSIQKAAFYTLYADLPSNYSITYRHSDCIQNIGLWP